MHDGTETGSTSYVCCVFTEYWYGIHGRAAVVGGGGANNQRARVVYSVSYSVYCIDCAA